MSLNTRSYEEMQIKVLRKTQKPDILLQQAADTTQKKYSISDFDKLPVINHKLIPHLVKANHMSLFEHMTISFGIEGVSRSLLAQITRHRLASYTVSSQHYQNYADYPMIMANEHMDALAPIAQAALNAYINAMEQGVPKEEARQILPSAMSCNLIWTINARSLFNFLNLRLCRRNTLEMLTFAQIIRYHATMWWPCLFKICGPDCFMTGKCTQAHMSCGEPISVEMDMRVNK